MYAVASDAVVSSLLLMKSPVATIASISKLSIFANATASFRFLGEL